MSCQHDDRFHCMGAKNGCLACHSESQQATINRLTADRDVWKELYRIVQDAAKAAKARTCERLKAELAKRKCSCGRVGGHACNCPANPNHQAVERREEKR